MATEQNFFGHDSHHEAGENATLMQKWKSMSVPTAVTNSEQGSFECNICLDSAYDPVVTLCGHLYCWPCIYKWIYYQRTSTDGRKQDPTCPVCKAIVSQNLLIPLYGHGTSSSESESKNVTTEGSGKPLDAVIPRRPPPSQLRTLLTVVPHQTRPLDPYGGFAAIATSNLGGAAIRSFFHPMIGLFGEVMLTRIFGTTNTDFLAYPYTNSSTYWGTINPRMRRQEMQLEKSLNRVTIFLLCCIMICLLLF